MSKVTAYFSHSIRGKKGGKATDEDMQRNCAAALEVARWIREVVPDIELYVPAEHEDFVYICYVDKYLTEEQILEVDCKILANQDFHIVHEVDGWLGGGIKVEMDHAKKNGKLIFYVSSMDDATAAALRVIVKDFQRARSK
jgi:hypothetical protein